jgi:hypothetical protein
MMGVWGSATRGRVARKGPEAKRSTGVRFDYGSPEGEKLTNFSFLGVSL